MPTDWKGSLTQKMRTSKSYPFENKQETTDSANLCYVWGEGGEGSSFESLGLPVFIGACCHPHLSSILAFCAASEWSAHCLRWDEEPSECYSLTGWSRNFSAENSCWEWMHWCSGVPSLSLHQQVSRPSGGGTEIVRALNPYTGTSPLKLH